MPGALPVANRRAVEQTILVGLALNCRIASDAVFARKNYFYPDLPKGYQISMFELPLCLDGWLEIEDEAGAPRRIRIRRVHLEEDTAKLLHAGDHSRVDLTRAGLPLIEIVTEPDIRTPEEARQYLTRLRSILRTLGVSTADMEKGAMRCEANVSLRPAGSEALGTKVEVKNLNSFRAVKQALEYAITRQGRCLAAGAAVSYQAQGQRFAPVILFVEPENNLDVALAAYSGDLSGQTTAEVTALAAADTALAGRPEILVLSPATDACVTYVIPSATAGGGSGSSRATTRSRSGYRGRPCPGPASSPPALFWRMGGVARLSSQGRRPAPGGSA